MTFVDDFLNRITMYRLVLWYLAILAVIAGIFGAFGWLAVNPFSLAFSFVLITSVSWLTNAVFVRAFRAQANTESVYITALILTLIVSPVAPTNLAGVGFLVFVSAWAMASKFVFAIGKKHVFNPAAFGVALGAFAASGMAATWWIAGNLPMLLFILVGGLLIVRKIHRFDLVLSFFAFALITTFATSTGLGAGAILSQTLLHSPIFFLGFIMLTEPLTMPPSRSLRLFYGALVGIFFAPSFSIGSFYFSPELALLAGNIFVYLVSPKGRHMLTLLERRQLATGTFEFIFANDRPLAFKPGQYLEWTLGHDRADNRGNRRYFTIASAPHEDVVRLGVRFYKPASSFKRTLAKLAPGDTISAAHVAGDFVLPRNKKQKLAFIAGGIGVTPFASMTRALIAEGKRRPVTLLYANKTAPEIAYTDLFAEAAQKIGMKTVYALSDEERPVAGAILGKIDEQLIEKEIPDYEERMFYISGPHGMVSAFTELLLDMGVPRHHIRTDYFPGFA